MIIRIIILSFYLELKKFEFVVSIFKVMDLFKLTSLLFWVTTILTILVFTMTFSYRFFKETYFFYYGYKKIDRKKIIRYIDIYENLDPQKATQYKLKIRLCNKMKKWINI